MALKRWIKITLTVLNGKACGAKRQAGFQETGIVSLSLR